MSDTNSIFDREIYPLPGGTNYYQPTNGITIKEQDKRSYYTKEEIDKIIQTISIAANKSSIASNFADLPDPCAENLGMIINVKDGFVTDNRFMDGAGKKYPSGTNVIVTLDQTDNTYKFDVLMGEIQAATNTDIQDIIDDIYKD